MSAYVHKIRGTNSLKAHVLGGKIEVILHNSGIKIGGWVFLTSKLSVRIINQDTVNLIKEIVF